MRKFDLVTKENPVNVIDLGIKGIFDQHECIPINVKMRYQLLFLQNQSVEKGGSFIHVLFIETSFVNNASEVIFIYRY